MSTLSICASLRKADDWSAVPPDPEPALEPEAGAPDGVRIVVRREPAAARKPGPGAARPRYSAEFVGGPHHGHRVTGRASPESAIGALIRSVAEGLDSSGAVLAFLAGLFADVSVRGVDVALARAVWIAAAHPRRLNRGVRIESPRPISQH